MPQRTFSRPSLVLAALVILWQPSLSFRRFTTSRRRHHYPFGVLPRPAAVTRGPAALRRPATIRHSSCRLRGISGGFYNSFTCTFQLDFSFTKASNPFIVVIQCFSTLPDCHIIHLEMALLWLCSFLYKTSLAYLPHIIECN